MIKKYEIELVFISQTFPVTFGEQAEPHTIFSRET